MKILKYNHEPGNIPASMRNLALFSSLRSSCIDEVLQHAAIVEMDAGDHLVSEGKPSDGLYILLKGKLSITRRDRQLAVLDRPGDLIGELAEFAEFGSVPTIGVFVEGIEGILKIFERDLNILPQ